MGRSASPKAGLDLEAHRDLGDLLRAVRQDLLSIRQVVRTAVGSAADSYHALGKILQAVGVAEQALRRDAEEAYGDDVPRGQLQALYGEREGA
jgi:hypothetical protein